MSSSSTKKLAAVPDETEEQEGVTYLTIRGKTYRIEELSQKDYEDCLRKAEVPDKENEGNTVTDNILLEKFLTLKSVSVVEKKGDPAGQKLDAEAWANEKMPVTSRIGLEVRRAHYMALTDEQLADIKAREAKGEKPNPNG